MLIIADYIWHTPVGFRWKTKVFHDILNKNEKGKPIFPDWNFDGNLTGQADPDKHSGCTDIRLRPVFVCDDPLRNVYTPKNKGDNNYKGYIVLCDIFHMDVHGSAIPEWRRPWAKLVMDEAILLKPMFSIEQELYIFDPRTRTPLGFPDSQNIRPQGIYYCRMGDNNGRALIEKHMELCLIAGIKISGTKADIGPSQWEYKIGPCQGIEAADHHVVSRYLMDRLAESFGVNVSWNPKPILGNWNSSGCHVTYSTTYMRGEVGSIDSYEAICNTIIKLDTFHPTMAFTFSKDNIKRLNGDYGTSHHNVFSWGIGTRNTSVRIPKSVADARKGYIEDRRPGADMDPYLTLGTIVYADLKGVIKHKDNNKL